MIPESDFLQLMTEADWQAITAPWPSRPHEEREVTCRFARNGFDWDMHGTVYLPETPRGDHAFVMTHGGAGSEAELHETPDGRPGLAPLLAGLGYPVLSVTYAGHWPPGGSWTGPVEGRRPVYLLDRDLPAEEIAERNRRCTFNLQVEGMARLADAHLPGHRILAFGHSTGGPMSMFLPRFLTRSTVTAILGWGSGGPDGWYREWMDWAERKETPLYPLDGLAHRSADSFARMGYVDPPELCPWGGAAEYTAWADRRKSQMKTALCDNQHMANIARLKEYARATGLPEAEFLDHLRDPDPDWLAATDVLLLVGENDRNHWGRGTTRAEKLEVFMGRKFAQRSRSCKVIALPGYGHFGFVGLGHERIAWLWARVLDSGAFALG